MCIIQKHWETCAVCSEWFQASRNKWDAFEKKNKKCTFFKDSKTMFSFPKGAILTGTHNVYQLETRNMICKYLLLLLFIWSCAFSFHWEDNKGVSINGSITIFVHWSFAIRYIFQVTPHFIWFTSAEKRKTEISFLPHTVIIPLHIKAIHSLSDRLHNTVTFALSHQER